MTLLQYWDGDVRDLHAPRPKFRVRITNKETGKSRIVILKEGDMFPFGASEDDPNWEIKTLGKVVA